MRHPVSETCGCRPAMALALLLTAAVAPAGAADRTVGAAVDGKQVVISVDHRALMLYRFGDVPFKPYVLEIRSPGGANVLREAPADHKHHHGLMFAVAVDGVDFWGELPTCGSQIAHAPPEVKTASHDGLSRATLSQALDWLGPDKTLLACEKRTIEVCAGGDLGATLLTWRVRLAPPPGKESIELSGHHYFGLGMRMAESMDKVGRFFNSTGQEGEIVRGKERLQNAAWCAYTAPVDGKPLTVALFDDPGNPRHPARMFTMPENFAYQSATLNLWKEPLVVPAAAPLQLCYGVAVVDGAAEPQQVQKLYQQWLAREK
jgi:hypothetical protein